jgi:hypothetical protein
MRNRLASLNMNFLTFGIALMGEVLPVTGLWPAPPAQPVVRKPEAMALIEISMSGSIASAEA